MAWLLRLTLLCRKYVQFILLGYDSLTVLPTLSVSRKGSLILFRYMGLLQMCVAASEGLSLQRKELPNFTVHRLIELVSLSLVLWSTFNWLVIAG